MVCPMPNSTGCHTASAFMRAELNGRLKSGSSVSISAMNEADTAPIAT